MIITIGGQKSGSEKVMICMQLAMTLSKFKPYILIAVIDLDSQEGYSLSLWKHSRHNINVIASASKPDDLIEKVKLEHDVVIVNAPSDSSMQLYQAVSVSDVFVIPVQSELTEMFDEATTVRAAELIKEELNPNLKILLLVQDAIACRSWDRVGKTEMIF